MRYMLLIYSREGEMSAEKEKAVAVTDHAVMGEATTRNPSRKLGR